MNSLLPFAVMYWVFQLVGVGFLANLMWNVNPSATVIILGSFFLAYLTKVQLTRMVQEQMLKKQQEFLAQKATERKQWRQDAHDELKAMNDKEGIYS